jgi:hypothetical protein
VTLFGILEDMGKEVYMAVHDQLGAIACRILVPGYSEVYPVEDLIWDNTNKALLFRADILNVHRLDHASLEALLERLNNNELDDYLDIGTLMCRAFFDVFSLPGYFPATAFAAWCEATSTGISRYCPGNRFFRPAIFGKSNCAI